MILWCRCGRVWWLSCRLVLLSANCASPSLRSRRHGPRCVKTSRAAADSREPAAMWDFAEKQPWNLQEQCVGKQCSEKNNCLNCPEMASACVGPPSSLWVYIGSQHFPTHEGFWTHSHHSWQSWPGAGSGAAVAAGDAAGSGWAAHTVAGKPGVSFF